VFVGNTVSGEESDILEVVNFLADFLNNDAQIKTWLADLIADRRSCWTPRATTSSRADSRR
jgi:hypothetical protein